MRPPRGNPPTSVNRGIQGNVTAGNVAVGPGARATSDNRVTITLGPGATFSGDVRTAQRIEHTLATAREEPRPDAKARLEELVLQVGKLVEALEADRDKQLVTRSLETLVEEARSDNPKRKWYEVSGEGIIEAAKAVASLTGPVTAAVKGVLALL